MIGAWRRPRDSEGHIKVTEAIFTFVALDEHGNKRVIRR